MSRKPQFFVDLALNLRVADFDNTILSIDAKLGLEHSIFVTYITLKFEVTFTKTSMIKYYLTLMKTQSIMLRKYQQLMPSGLTQMTNYFAKYRKKIFGAHNKEVMEMFYKNRCSLFSPEFCDIFNTFG